MKGKDMSNKTSIKNELDLLEEAFFDPKLLNTKYLTLLRKGYEKTYGTPFFNHYRSYPRLIKILQKIFHHDENHAKSYAKRLRAQQKDFNNCEAIFCEAIVHSYYASLVPEGILRNLDIRHDDYDLCIERADKSKFYLEIFCVMPNLKSGEGINNVKSHLQTSVSSIRGKLLNKIKKQKQLTKARENWVVIELNSPS
ncbi:MAG: hypothetical protein AAF708_21140, partial [Deinococcota bacterium]